METIRTALAMGAEKGIHIADPALDSADAYATATALAAAIKGIPYDISSAASGPSTMTPVRSVPSWRICWEFLSSPS